MSERRTSGSGDPANTKPARSRPPLLPLLAGIAALVAVGLGVSALVVALNDNGNSSSTPSSGAAPTSCSVAAVAQKGLPSVVTVRVSGAAQGGATGGGVPAGTGSGEVIDTSGHILTNNHVISPAASGGAITVIFADGHAETARLVGRDSLTDLAVLQVPNASGLTPITFGSSSQLQVGQPVVALGAPLGLSNTVTSGIVSALGRSVNVPADNGATATLVSAIQTDAAINPGNSGGALVNCSSQLIGVPTAGATVPIEGGGTSAGSIGIGFAIPSDFAKDIADELISTGKVSHGLFGLTVVTVSTQESGGERHGLYITSVTTGGPADQAGLQPGDVITAINGTPATSAEQLQSLTLQERAGSTVTVTYERAGTTHQAEVTLGSR